MNLSENSRIWIYQSTRSLTPAEEVELKRILEGFVSQWQAHGHELAASAEVRYNRFIILAVDESKAGASGCSIDKSVNLMKELESLFDISLFDRFNIAYKVGDNVLSASREEFEKLIQAGEVTENTIVFNNLVQTIGDLKTKWEVPFKESWHPRVFGEIKLPA